MALNAGTAYIDVKPNMDTFSKGIQGGLSSLSSKLSSAGKKLSLGVTAPLALLAKSSISAFEESEEVAGVFEKTLDNVGLAGEVNAKRVEDAFDSLSQKIGIDDEELTQLAGKLASAIDFSTFANPEEKLEKLTLAVENFSAQTGKSTSAAQKLFASIANDPASAIGTLVKLGVITKKQGEQFKKMADHGKSAAVSEQLLAAASKKYQGAAKAGATTSEKLAVQFDKFKETIGKILLPIFKKFSDILGTVLDWFDNLSPGAKKLAVTIAAIAAAIGPLLLIISKLINAFKVVNEVMRLTALANPWTAIIAGVIILVVVIVKNWDKIKKVILAAWAVIKKAAFAVWDAIKKAFNVLVQVITHNPIFLLLKAEFNLIKGVIVGVFNFVRDHWRGIVEFFRGIWRTVKEAFITAWHAMRDVGVGVWDAIVSAATTALNIVIGLLNQVIRGINDVIQGMNDLNGPANFLDLPKVPPIPTLAQGGIVRRPTIAMIGEAGPEAVVPLRGGARGPATLRILDWRHGIAELSGELDWAVR